MFTHPFSLGSSRVWSFLRLCLFLISLAVWRRDWSGILQNVPQLGFVWWFSSWWNWAHGLGEENHRDKGPFSSCPIKSTYYEQNFSLLMLTLIIWLRVFVRPLSWTVPLFHLSVLSSLEGSTYFFAQHTLKKWGVTLYLLGGVYITWDSFAQICLPSPVSLCSQSLTVVCCCCCC